MHANNALSAPFLALDAAQIRLLIPSPPVVGGDAEAAEFVALKALQSARIQADIDLANLDAVRGPVEWATHTLGRRFCRDQLPLTTMLLRDVHENARLINRSANAAYPFRLRPWAVSSAITPALTSEIEAKEKFQLFVSSNVNKKAVDYKTQDEQSKRDAGIAAGPSSYPSARALASQLWAHTLASLVPTASADLFAAASHTAVLRLIGGAHFPSDVVAATRLADAVWRQLKNQPQFEARLTAARVEINSVTCVTTKLDASQNAIFNRQKLPIAEYLGTVLVSPTPMESMVGDAAKLQMTWTQSQRNLLQLADAQQVEVLNFWPYTSTHVGAWASAKNAPQLEVFLHQVRSEFEPILLEARRQYRYPRPFQAVTTLQPGWKTGADTSYPSAKVWLFRIQAEILAALQPALMPSLNAAMQRLDHNRVIGGSHWPLDVTASQHAAKRMVVEVLSSPIFVNQRDELTAELAKAMNTFY